MKLLAALSGLMIAIASVAGLVFARSAASGCDDRTLEDTRSPDGRVGALLYERRCGDERTTRLRLWLVDNPRTPADVWAVAGAALPRVRFAGARAVVLEGVGPGRPLLLESAWRDVTIAAK